MAELPPICSSGRTPVSFLEGFGRFTLICSTQKPRNLLIFGCLEGLELTIQRLKLCYLALLFCIDLILQDLNPASKAGSGFFNDMLKRGMIRPCLALRRDQFVGRSLCAVRYFLGKQRSILYLESYMCDADNHGDWKI